MSTSLDSNDEIIIHVLVVGFHHKKGCVVEYSYPSLSESNNELPEVWKHLPTLALPDGAHNFEQDTIYFHLPSLENPQRTVYGISCYRQMNAQQLLRRSSDITRETVQKSVCVLSRLPLYGLIQAKLELITHAYFDERDFSKVSLLEETYKNLNTSLPKDLLDGQQAFLGLSVREFVLRFKHKALLLFKLLLLEKRVLFYKAPVKNLCSTVLTLCSLIPGMIESGLGESAQDVVLNTISDEGFEEVPKINCDNSTGDKSESTWYEGSLGSGDTKALLNNNVIVIPPEDNVSKDALSQSSSDTEGESWIKVNQITPDLGSSATSITSSDTEMKADNTIHNTEEKLLNEIEEVVTISQESNSNCRKPSLEFQNVSSPTVCDNSFAKGSSNSLKSAESDISALEDPKKVFQKSESQSHYDSDQSFDDNDANIIIDLETSDCGLPLSIFTKGMICHPYLSLPFLDILSDVSIRGFLVGATNILFKQKKHLFDAIVEVDEGKIEILDTEIRKNVNLSTEDLRFADHLVRHVMDDKKDVFLDGTGWEGGDEWLRSQFKLYLVSIMRTSLIESTYNKEIEAFNSNFMNAWKLTHNYKIWIAGDHSKVLKVNPGHPFHGQLSMADMRLRFSHSMQNTERGRRINNAVSSTGKAVVQTSKVVGGALSSAKSMVSSWWSTINVPQQLEKREEKNSETGENITSEKTMIKPLNLEP